MTQWNSKSICVGPTKLRVDMAPDEGTSSAAMTPSEGLLVALGDCLGMLIAQACCAEGIPFEGATLQVAADEVDERRRLDNFRVTVHMPEPRDERSRGIAESASLLSQVRNTLRHGARVEVQFVE